MHVSSRSNERDGLRAPRRERPGLVRVADGAEHDGPGPVVPGIDEGPQFLTLPEGGISFVEQERRPELLHAPEQRGR